MKSTRVLSVVVIALALIGTLAWFLLGLPRQEESALSVHEVAVEESRAVHAELESTHASTSISSEAEPLRETVNRVVAPAREWKLRVVGVVYSDGADSEEEGLLEGAEVDVLASDDSGERTRSFGRHVTDAKGSFAVEMEFDPSWMNPDSGEFPVYLELKVWAPGHCSGEWDDGVDLNEVEEHEFSIPLSPGAEVSGFVYAADGSPVQAAVYIDINGEQHHVNCEEDGSYLLNLERGGVGSILARREPYGTARINNLEVDPAVRTLVPDLYLSGTGVLGGVLLNPSGTPIAGYTVTAVSEELVENSTGSPNTWSFLPGRTAENLAAERGDGLLLLSTQTDSNGAFSFEGLRPGRYLVYAQHGRNELAVETKRELFTTGNLDIHLILAVHRLEVTVKGGAGTQDVYCRLWGKNRDPEFGDPRARLINPSMMSPISFTVDPGRTYLVGLHDENFQVRQFFPNPVATGLWEVWSDERRVKIEEGVYVTKIELDPRADRGSLFIDIEDSQESTSYSIRIRSMYSETPIHSGSVSPEQLPLRVEVGAGKYRVEVVANVSAFQASRLIEYTFGQQAKPEDLHYNVSFGWREVTVQSGDEHRLNFELSKGGRLRVRMPPNPIPAGSPSMTPEWRGALHFRLQSSSDEFELENARGERTQDLTFNAVQPFVDVNDEAQYSTQLGLAEPLLAGKYTLRWRQRGEPVVELPFEIREGEMTTVQLEVEKD